MNISPKFKLFYISAIIRKSHFTIEGAIPFNHAKMNILLVITHLEFDVVYTDDLACHGLFSSDGVEVSSGVVQAGRTTTILINWSEVFGVLLIL